MDWSYWEKKVEENTKKSESESSKFDDYDEDYYREVNNARTSEDNAIDDLFSKAD